MHVVLLRRWRLLPVIGGLCGLIAVTACQDYPFEPRDPLRVDARKITDLVAVARPTDILFVVDNSNSMADENTELARNMEKFVSDLAETTTDFQVGFVAPDINKNIPLGPDTTCSEDVPSNTSTCDAGRLRSYDGVHRIFGRPGDGAAEKSQWVANVTATIDAMMCTGTGFEAGLEAAWRAVACAVGDTTCPDDDVKTLNAGFIRENADLVLVFVSDEDDCSFADASVYEKPTQQDEQNAHLCGESECYWHYFVEPELNIPLDWSSIFSCGGNRVAYPPTPKPVEEYVNAFIALKGGDISRVRAAGILGGALDASEELGFASAGCHHVEAVGPNTTCGCWSASSGYGAYCEITEVVGSGSIALPDRPPTDMCDAQNVQNDGCEAMPSNRYVQFLRRVAQLRRQAVVAEDTLVDSICQARYDSTMFAIVNNVILSNCFAVQEPPEGVEDMDEIVENIRVELNGEALHLVESDSETPGWSWRPDSSEICLEGGLRKRVGDTYEIFVVDS